MAHALKFWRGLLRLAMPLKPVTVSETDCFKPLVARARVTMDNSNVGIRCTGTVWSQAIVSLLFGSRNRLA